MDVVRKAQRDSPVEWDAYEQRCSVLVLRNLEEDARLRKSSESQVPAARAGEPARGKRRHSTSSMAPPPAYPAKPQSWWSANASAKLPGPPVNVARAQAARLAFLDYLVKPVQRICRYPLLFDQLGTARPAREVLYSPRDHGVAADIVVESAAQAMRHVVALVDEARDRQDVFTKTALIVARVVGMPPDFMESLGPCVLAGSLDVIQEFKAQSGGVVDAKYLGVFLYTGGYLLMAKVGEGRGKARVYEPKHWFSLAGGEVEDVGDDEGICRSLPVGIGALIVVRCCPVCQPSCPRRSGSWSRAGSSASPRRASARSRYGYRRYARR